MGNSRKIAVIVLAILAIAAIGFSIFIVTRLQEQQAPDDTSAAGGAVACGDSCTVDSDCADTMSCYDNHCFECNGQCANDTISCTGMSTSCDDPIDLENVPGGNSNGIAITNQFESLYGITFSTGDRESVDGNVSLGACSYDGPTLYSYETRQVLCNHSSYTKGGFKNDALGSYHPQTRQRCIYCDPNDMTCHDPCQSIQREDRLWYCNYLDADVQEAGGSWYVSGREGTGIPCPVIVELTVPTTEFSLDLIDIDNLEGWDVIGYDDDDNEIARMHHLAGGTDATYDGDLLHFRITSDQLIYRVVIQPYQDKAKFGFAMDNFSPYCATAGYSCGDGVADPSEECGEPGLSCEVGETCTNCICEGIPEPACGDGNADPGELCGEPGLSCASGEICTDCLCQAAPACGDGNADPGELCGEPGLSCPGTQICNNNTCLCEAAPACGDGNTDPGEQCGEPGLSCPSGQTCTNCVCQAIPVPACGDGNADPGEQCGEPGLSCPSGYSCSNCVCILDPLPNTGLFDDPGGSLILIVGLGFILAGLVVNRYGSILSLIGISDSFSRTNATGKVVSSLADDIGFDVESMLAVGEEGYHTKVLRAQKRKIRRQKKKSK